MTIKDKIQQKTRENFGNLPLSFIPNAGQVHEDVRYYMHAARVGIFFTQKEVIFAFQKSSKEGKEKNSLNHLSLKFIRANSKVKVEGLQESTGKVNYFIGKDPSKWVTNLSTFQEVLYRELWSGVDLVFRGERGQLKYEFIVQPGASIQDIRLAYQGAEDLALDEEGNLQIYTSSGVILDKKPLSYQKIEGQLVEINSFYDIEEDEIGKKTLGFRISQDVDPRYPLIIDPALAYSTYLGGTLDERANGIAVDSDGFAYVAGSSTSVDYPTQNPFQGSLAGSGNAVITKFSQIGETLIYSTYLGGDGFSTCEAIAVDSNGSAYVTGSVLSNNFPLMNPFQTTPAGIFVTKLNPDGNALVYSTYLGGQQDTGWGIAVDSSGSAYVTGQTNSDTFPIQNAFQGTYAGQTDAFVTKFSPAGNSLIYSTYLGGSQTEIANGIAVDSSGSAYVTGFTTSTDFPTQNPFQSTFMGRQDAFVTKLSPSGNSLVYSTYLGGTDFDFARAIAVDSSGSAYITGGTSSQDFPLQNAFQSVLQGASTIFVTKFSPEGNTLVYSTYVGGGFSSANVGLGIAVDTAGSAYITGSTEGIIPVVNPIPGGDVYHGGGSDAFVIKFSSSGNSLIYSTFIGGSNLDQGNAIALDSSGSAYITGYTKSDNYPTQNAFQPNLAGGDDIIVTKIIEEGPCTPSITLTITSINHSPFTPCPYKITGNVTCSGSPVAGASVTLTKSFSGAGTISISPTTATTNGTGDYQSAMTAPKPTNGTVTVTASAIVNGTPVSTSVTMPVIC